MDFTNSRKVSVSTALFDGYSMAFALEEIARAGARYVEPAFIKGYVEFDESAFSEAEATRLADLAASHGLGIDTVSAHMDLGLPQAFAMLDRRITFAATLGARILITNAGKRSAQDAVLRTIDPALPRLEDTGIVLALENPGHGNGDMIECASDGAALIAELASPLLRLNYDTGNVFTYSGEQHRPETDIRAALPFLANLHLKDVASDADGWRFTALGQGSIDYAALWPLLPRDMPVGIELPLRLRRPGRADPTRGPAPLPLENIRQALRDSLSFVARLDASG